MCNNQISSETIYTTNFLLILKLGVSLPRYSCFYEERLFEQYERDKIYSEKKVQNISAKGLHQLYETRLKSHAIYSNA